MRIAGSLQRVQTEQSCIVIHHFPEDYIFEEPSAFTDPFRYIPHPAVKAAAGFVCERIKAEAELADAFAEGKMMGVLVCKDQETGSPGYIAAFSGNAGGRNHIDGFVPPIYDLLAPDGHFKIREAEITQINHNIQELSSSETFNSYRLALESSIRRRDTAIAEFRAQMADPDFEGYCHCMLYYKSKDSTGAERTGGTVYFPFLRKKESTKGKTFLAKNCVFR